jgi:ribosomal protein S18 acetylase RimI-like enzyme
MATAPFTDDLSPAALVEAIEANVVDLFGTFRRWPRAAFGDEADLLWSVTDVPFPLFNGVLRARFTADSADARIEAAIARCRAKGVPMLWWTGPASQPAGLGDILQAHGLVLAADLPGMAADLHRLREAGPAPTGLSISRVTGAEALAGWCRTFAAGFGLPAFVGDAFLDCLSHLELGRASPFHHYAGHLDGTPVATASVYLGAGVAGIYNVSVLPSARRLGIGAAVTLAPLRDARERGARVGILHASEMGAGVYRSLGFEERCRIRQYLWSGASGDRGART